MLTGLYAGWAHGIWIGLAVFIGHLAVNGAVAWLLILCFSPGIRILAIVRWAIFLLVVAAIAYSTSQPIT